MISRPHFTATMSLAGCCYDVRLNGVSVMSDRNGYPVQAEIPINHWLCTGRNILALRVDPLPGASTLDDEVNCILELHVRESGTDRTYDKSLVRVRADRKDMRRIDDDTVSSADLGLGPASRDANPTPEEIVVVRSDFFLEGTCGVSLRVAWPRWTWLDGDQIEPTTSMRDSLFAEYYNIWSALHARQTSRVMPLFAQRTKELAAAFYQTEQTLWNTLDLDTASHDPSLELFPLDEELEFEVSGDGRLARLARWDGEPAIVFVAKDRAFSQYYDVMFCRRDGAWKIIR